MLELNATAQFRRDRRLCVKRGYDMSLLNAVVDTLRIPAPLPPEKRDHVLTGNYAGRRECHIQPDWLLIYRVEATRCISTARARIRICSGRNKASAPEAEGKRIPRGRFRRGVTLSASPRR